MYVCVCIIQEYAYYKYSRTDLRYVTNSSIKIEMNWYAARLSYCSVGVYVYVCVCVCVRLVCMSYVCMHVCVCVCVCVYVRMCTRISILICMRMYVCVYTSHDVRMYVCMYSTSARNRN
jgi:hypothetical protein